ncbi:uroporphyrinogen-III C-methyltransferase [Hydrogenophaga sp.]|uniref:uroporphyrinogen-III C-methyltransferase n=1 Tax=Hydrogenophaga sp. TaxID=1904254 RepID=UPI00391A8C24
MLAPTSTLATELAPGSVALVGAGPGDPELLTLRAWRRLQQADVVLHDHLVGPGVIDNVAASAERICVGKSAGRHSWSQEAIGSLLVQKARAGLRVVRLKGGDPFIFGRGGEEMDVLLAHGISVEVVPGITAALGAAASLGFPLTHRDHAQSCVFVTGHLKDQRMALNWPALAQPNQTVVVYMGVTGLDTITRELQAAGLPGNTPAALIHRATCPEQRVFPTSLAALPATARDHAVRPPSLLVIGQVVRLLARHSVL